MQEVEVNFVIFMAKYVAFRKIPEKCLSYS